MRRSLMAIGIVLLALGPVTAQPPSNRVGKASVAPEVQDRAQAELRRQAGPEQNNRQNNRTERARGERDVLRGNAPQPQSDNSRGDNRRADRGRGEEHREGWQRDRRRDGNWRSHDRRDWERRVSSDRRDWNRDGRTSYRAPYGGPRRDFSGFRDFHRSYDAPRRFRAPYYRRPAGWYEHRWTFGEFLPTAFWVRDYWLEDFWVYDLPSPPYGAIWVRVGPDALLIDEDSGEIITVAYRVFY